MYNQGEKVASGKQPVEHVPRKQNQAPDSASDSAGSTTQIHMNNMVPELKSNVVNQSDTLTSAGGGVGSLLPKEPVLLDERCLLACIVRAVPAGSDNRIRISSTVSATFVILLLFSGTFSDSCAFFAAAK